MKVHVQNVCAEYKVVTPLVKGALPPAFLSPADFFFSKSKLSKNYFRKTTNYRLDPDQARHFVGPDLAPNCLQKLSVDATRI